jgi:hypothetical protein
MKSLEEFQNELVRVMQRLGAEPSLEDVESAGIALVKDGIPEGADLEGLLLLRDLARQRASTGDSKNDPEARNRKDRRPG